MYGSVFGQWTEISPTRAYDVMGWICLSITSYMMAIGLGVWIGRVSIYFGPWLDGIVDHCIGKFQRRPDVEPTTTAPPDTANVQDTETFMPEVLLLLRGPCLRHGRQYPGRCHPDLYRHRRCMKTAVIDIIGTQAVVTFIRHVQLIHWSHALCAQTQQRS